jgi:membrane-associated phospholipid phosphatase
MWAFFPIKRLRAGAILLNLVALAATPIQGAHYFVDLIGGAVLAAISIYATLRLTSAALRAGPVAVQQSPQGGVVSGSISA